MDLEVGSRPELGADQDVTARTRKRARDCADQGGCGLLPRLRVLRPALVGVSKGGPKAAPTPDSEGAPSGTA